MSKDGSIREATPQEAAPRKAVQGRAKRVARAPKAGVVGAAGLDKILGAALVVLALALFLPGITIPAAPYFDETHYVPAARALLARSGPVNIEHPLFAKTLIAAGMALLALALGASGWLRARTGALWLGLGIYLFSLGIWIVIPKPIGFFYYYNLSAIALCLVIAAVLDAARARRTLTWVTVASALVFAYFYPILAAQPLPTDDTWTNWVWMPSWY